MNAALRIFIIVIVAITAAATGLYVSQRSSGASNTAVTDDAAELLLRTTLPDTQGTEQTLEQWRGDIIVANFWATWCPPCIKEIPEFAAVSRSYTDQPVQFVGLAIDTAENVRDFQEQFDVPYPLLVGGSETLQLASDFGNTARALPFTVIVDRDGSVADITLGTLNEDDLIERLDKLLGQ
ncbi:MAG TPA: TlpA disulfide reductase family protein [Azoarcus sp.]|nr:TlpA disulfide reductase family protein [Azoarcus sp.]